MTHPERRTVVIRAIAALLWATALVLALGGDDRTTASAVPAGAALLLSAYPAIDVVASLVRSGADRVRQVNAAISAAAVVALAATAFGADAGAVLLAFGAWAAVSGAIQLGVALHRRSGWPMLVSGGLSTIAGVAFAASSAGTSANLSGLAGYAAVGAVLYLVWALRASSAGLRAPRARA